MENLKLYTIKEAAKHIEGLTEFRIRQMCITGELPCVKAGRKYLICGQVLEKYLTEAYQNVPTLGGMSRSHS
ncbi:hypothetical protein FACS1894120_5540 [Clostridia bacterium]|nr:hypothetical protein FACS1894120_5540 [Clostridia bacterium]